MPPGEYVLDAPIRVPNGTTVDLTNVTLRYPSPAGFRSLLDISGSRGVEVFGGTFDGNVAAQPTWREQGFRIDRRPWESSSARTGGQSIDAIVAWHAAYQGRSIVRRPLSLGAGRGPFLGSE